MHIKPLFSAVILSLSPTLAAAAEAECGLAYIQIPLGSTVTWSGGCVNGYAHGNGVLRVMRGKTRVLYYKGDIQEGVLHGKGIMHRMDGEYYEGSFEHDNPHGFGVSRTRSGKYEGEWKAGKREGKGKMEFVLGGTYDGEWKNNRFHGLGTARYMSGREVTAQFVDGIRAGLPPVSRAEAKYMIASDFVTGSHIREVAIRNGVVPFTKSYDSMNDSERATVRSWYPLLDDNDEPPYPIRGTAPLYKSILEVTQFTSVRGTVHLLVDVNAYGVVRDISLIAAPDPDLAKVVALVAEQQHWKPGKCAGQPCAMKFPLSISVGSKVGSPDDVR